jgi:hypothetical protein
MPRRALVLVVLIALIVTPRLASPLWASPITITALTITQAEVDKLIDQLGDPVFANREAAQAELIKRAGESVENARLIEKRLNEKGLASDDLEIKKRSGEILIQLIPLGAFTLTIDDTTDTVKVTSDSLYKTTSSVTEQETATIEDPFFAGFTGPTKIVYLIEPGAVPDKDGLIAVSDIISLSKVGANFTNALDFNSDDPKLEALGTINCSVAAELGFVCLPETGAPQDLAKAIFGDKSGFLVLNVTSDISEVPEPSTLALLGLGVSGLLRYRRSIWRSNAPPRVPICRL